MAKKFLLYSNKIALGNDYIVMSTLIVYLYFKNFGKGFQCDKCDIKTLKSFLQF